MKALDIALKDLLRQFRSAFAMIMMFVMPLFVTGLFFLAFGGIGGDEDGAFDLPVTQVQVVNLDRPGGDGFSAGQMLVDFLKSEDLQGLLNVVEATDEASARTAVDRQEAGVAVIVPDEFTSVLTAASGSAEIVLYPDPTLAVGPDLVKGLINRFVDTFSGTKIAAGIVIQQLAQRDVAWDLNDILPIAEQYGEWASAQGEQYSGGTNPALDVHPPAPEEEPTEENDLRGEIISAIMTSMMIFFAFFTGATTAETIVREEEEGTLARLFTTPTPRAVILGGKFCNTFVMLVVQICVLLLVGGLIFSIRWGNPFTVALLILGTVVSSGGFGVFLMSFVRNTRQAGPIIGIVMAVTGMAGGMFTAAFENVPKTVDTVSLFTPQGWVMRGWKRGLAGGGVTDVLPSAGVTIALGIAFFAAGVFMFRRRFMR